LLYDSKISAILSNISPLRLVNLRFLIFTKATVAAESA
jgi:hypothetical protein